MTRFDNTENKIKNFGRGYSVSYEDDGKKRIYTIASSELKSIVSPFPPSRGNETFGVGRETEERDKDGNYFSYKQGIGNSLDQFIVITGHELDPQRKLEAERQRREVAD